MIGKQTTKDSGIRTRKSEYPRKFSTAGGLITVHEQAHIHVKGIDTSITPWVSPDCPELLSVGKRINEGHSFVWPQRGSPFFTNADGTVVKLKTRNNIPFIDNATIKTPPGKYESNIVNAINVYNYDQQPKRKGMDIIAPLVDNDEAEHDQDEGVTASGEDEEPLSPAQRIEHLLTHLPKRRDCDTCQRAKMRAARRYRNSYNPQVTTWGELVSADHVKGNGLDLAVGDEIGALILKDAHTGLVGYYGVRDQTWETTKWAIREYKGNRNIQLLYTDGAPEIIRAARELDILHRTSTPGVPQNNCVIEREVQECIRGTRALLLAAGLPTAFWVQAAETFAFNKNITKGRDGDSPYGKTNGVEYKGMRIPFGSKIYFIPSPTKNVSMAKMEPAAQVGLFAGYAIAPGYTWTGDYYVWLLDDFEGVNLHRNAIIRSQKLAKPHRTRNVEIPTGPVTFPLKSNYETCNAEIPGQPAATEDNVNFGMLDKWIKIGTWWIRKHNQPRKYRYRPCLETGGPVVDTLSPWRMTVKLGKDGCADTYIDRWNSEDNEEEEPWSGMTLFSAHLTSMEITHKTTVGRKPNFAPSGGRLADTYDSRANTQEFDRRLIDNQPWDGDTPPLPLDGATDTDFFRGDDGIWRVRSRGRAWKVDRNGVRWTRARLREGQDSTRPPDVAVRNWHTRLTAEQKRSFHKRRRTNATADTLQVDPIPNSDTEVPEIFDAQDTMNGSHLPSPTGGDISDGIILPPDESGGVDDERQAVGETQHFNISTPIPSVIDEEENANTTPVPTPRVHDGETDKEPENEVNTKTKRRKTETNDVSRTLLAYPPGIRLRKKTSAAEINRMRNEAGSTSRPTMPGSSNDHLLRTRESEPRDRMDDASENTSVAIDVVSDASHDGSVKIISLPSEGDSSAESEDSGGESDKENSRVGRSRSRNPKSNESSRSRSGHREKNYRNTAVFSQAFVARNVSLKERREVPKAQAAMKKEWDNLREKGCWDENNPRDWYHVRKEAKEQGKTVHIGRLVPLCVEKNSELAPDDPSRKYKGRVVFQGNMVKDQDYENAEFENLGSSPATMESSKSADAYGCIKSNMIQIADAEQAYIQADMKGKDTWILIPEEDRPKWWAEEFPYMKMPVVLMKKALYGHPDAGSYWEQKADEQARKVGFVAIEDWPSTYFHNELKLMLIIYVDDFKLAGPVENMERGWELLREGIKIGKPEVIDENGASYLGCKQKRFNKIQNDGTLLSVMEYDMKEFVQSCIEKYVEMAEIGSEPKHYSTPMLPEEIKGSPDDDGRCPWCEKVPKVRLNQIKEMVDDEYDGVIGKSFKGRSGKIVMKLLWVARICRYDILKAVTHLASFASKWERHHDVRLKRLIGYLARTKNYCLYGWIGDGPEDLNPVLYADSDFAGCTATRKSTSGMIHQLAGPKSCFPLAACSKKQNCVSNSTAEAELIATSMAVRNTGLPALNIWDKVLERKALLKIYEDNTAMIKLLNHGYSPSMRYLGRTHAVSISAMKEVIDLKQIEVEYIGTKEMKADILTKGFASRVIWDNARIMIMTGNRDEFEELF